MRRAAITVCLLAAAALPQAAGAHSLVRPAGALISYLSQDATSLNTLAVRPDGDRIEFHDPSVDGGLDPGGCTPGSVAGGFIVQAFCPASGVARVRLDLGEREDSARCRSRSRRRSSVGPGADQLTGGPVGDELTGGDGNDTLSGGDGDDPWSATSAPTPSTAAPGPIGSLVRDGLADDVSCGDGVDTVEADALDTVAADCEDVARTHRTARRRGATNRRPPILEVERRRSTPG